MTHDNNSWDDDEETIINFTPKPRPAQPPDAEIAARNTVSQENAAGKIPLTGLETPPASGMYGGDHPVGGAPIPAGTAAVPATPSIGQDPYLAGSGFQHTLPAAGHGAAPPPLPPLPPLPGPADVSDLAPRGPAPVQAPAIPIAPDNPLPGFAPPSLPGFAPPPRPINSLPPQAAPANFAADLPTPAPAIAIVDTRQEEPASPEERGGPAVQFPEAIDETPEGEAQIAGESDPARAMDMDSPGSEHLSASRRTADIVTDAGPASEAMIPRKALMDDVEPISAAGALDLSAAGPDVSATFGAETTSPSEPTADLSSATVPPLLGAAVTVVAAAEDRQDPPESGRADSGFELPAGDTTPDVQNLNVREAPPAAEAPFVKEAAAEPAKSPDEQAAAGAKTTPAAFADPPTIMDVPLAARLALDAMHPREAADVQADAAASDTDGGEGAAPSASGAEAPPTPVRETPAPTASELAVSADAGSAQAPAADREWAAPCEAAGPPANNGSPTVPPLTQGVPDAALPGFGAQAPIQRPIDRVWEAQAPAFPGADSALEPPPSSSPEVHDPEPESEMERTNVHLAVRPMEAVADFAWLAILKSPSGHANQIYRIDAIRMELGRAFDAPIFVDDKTVSSRHAAIRYERVNERFEFVLYDLASTNGSYVNGLQTHLAVLKDDDRIRVGETELVFKKVGDPPAADQ